MRRLRVQIVQQGAWDTARESLPLAAGYLAATIQGRAGLSRDVAVEIVSFRGGTDVAAMARRLFVEPPDVLAFSVQGWNFRHFVELADTFKQVRSDGLVIFGGTHVANQAERVFRLCPAVDMVANGEGEHTLAEILQHVLAGRRDALGGLAGVSVRLSNDEFFTSAAAPRIQDLDAIPSPFLTGAIPLATPQGDFRYDVALMETNRGCPYSCAMCFWGGAIGQKVRKFSRERLREELELFGRSKASNLVLCDANFGVFEEDLLFVEDLIRTREKFGFPQTLDTSWAKNKSARFYELVRLMKQHRLSGSFTLALQSLDSGALELMRRQNMKINAWEDLAAWLREEGVDCYGELIWGAPGETADSFLAGYNKLARVTPRIAVYPLQVLPNTEYASSRKTHGLTTIRQTVDDFEYVLEHDKMSLSDNVRIQDFMFWARTLGEHMLLRYTWSALRRFCGLEQGDVVRRFTDWIADSSHPAAARLRDRPGLFVTAEVVSWQLRRIYDDPAFASLMSAWWTQDIVSRIPLQSRQLATLLFEFDQICRPMWDPERETGDLRIDAREGLTYLVKRAEVIDAPAVAAALDAGAEPGQDALQIREVDIRYRAGFREFVDSHEIAAHFFGKPDWDTAATPCAPPAARMALGRERQADGLLTPVAAGG
ncbi:MAG TPA: KedN5 family methylcobalamin-dependent radical SAM C-methyltransferase [Caulobacteraceae bacterium]|jgi:radical SAM superfamily enzyme YgiQ (UPF0313 family)